MDNPPPDTAVVHDKVAEAAGATHVGRTGNSHLISGSHGEVTNNLHGAGFKSRPAPGATDNKNRVFAHPDAPGATATMKSAPGVGGNVVVAVQEIAPDQNYVLVGRKARGTDLGRPGGA